MNTVTGQPAIGETSWMGRDTCSQSRLSSLTSCTAFSASLACLMENARLSSSLMKFRTDGTNRSTVSVIRTRHAGARCSSCRANRDAQPSTRATVAQIHCSQAFFAALSFRQWPQMVWFGLSSFLGMTRIHAPSWRQPSGRS